MLTLKLLLLSLTCVDLHSDNDIESECRYGARNKYSESYNRWSHYLDSIAAAEKSHTPCEEAGSCSSCHDAVIAQDWCCVVLHRFHNRLYNHGEGPY